MEKIQVLSILCQSIILNASETAGRSMAPRIIEPPQDYNIQVEAGTKIDLSCSAMHGSESSVEALIIYWLINGTFPEVYSNVKEGHQRISKKGDQYYSNIILHIDGVIKELYNIPITCIASSPWGGDNSTLYLRIFKTGTYTWAVTIPLCLVVFVLLVAFSCKYVVH